MHGQGTLCALSRGFVELDQIERGTIGMHGHGRIASRERCSDAWLQHLLDRELRLLRQRWDRWKRWARAPGGSVEDVVRAQRLDNRSERGGHSNRGPV